MFEGWDGRDVGRISSPQRSCSAGLTDEIASKMSHQPQSQLPVLLCSGLAVFRKLKLTILLLIHEFWPSRLFVRLDFRIFTDLCMNRDILDRVPGQSKPFRLFSGRLLSFGRGNGDHPFGA